MWNSGTSAESESEFDQEKVQPTMEESGTKSGSDRVGSDGEAQMARRETTY